MHPPRPQLPRPTRAPGAGVGLLRRRAGTGRHGPGLAARYGTGPCLHADREAARRLRGLADAACGSPGGRVKPRPPAPPTGLFREGIRMNACRPPHHRIRHSVLCATLTLAWGLAGTPAQAQAWASEASAVSMLPVGDVGRHGGGGHGLQRLLGALGCRQGHRLHSRRGRQGVGLQREGDAMNGAISREMESPCGPGSPPRCWPGRCGCCVERAVKR